jgi:hypothetical protein
MGVDLPADLNPYDFRSPVVDPARLVGRERELAELRGHLQLAAIGGSAQVLVVGEPGLGKTSILNAAQALALEERVLPVRLDLDEGVVASQLAFFVAMFDSAVSQLVERGALAPDDPRYLAWLAQLDSWERSIPPNQQLLRIGARAAAGEDDEGRDVSPALLSGDCRTVAGLAAAAGFRGVALLIDEGDLFAGRPVLVEKLSNLFRAFAGGMLGAAATPRLLPSLGESFSPLGRRFAEIRLQPFQRLGDADQCLTAPLERVGLAETRPSKEVVWDVFELTGGRPDEIMLVSHCIWTTLQRGIVERFDLSQAALELVLDELVTSARDDERNEFEVVGRLTAEEWRLASGILPYERLTETEVACLRRFPIPLDERGLDEERQCVSAESDRLSELGLVVVKDGSLLLRGGSPVRRYLNYWRRAHGFAHEAPAASYPFVLARKLAERFRAELLDPLDDSGDVWARMTFVREVGFDPPGESLRSVVDAATERDVEKLAESWVAPGIASTGRGKTWLDESSADVIFVGLVVDTPNMRSQASVTHEVCLFTPNRWGQEPVAIKRETRAWMVKHRAALESYRATIERNFVATLNAATWSQLLTRVAEQVGSAQEHSRSRPTDRSAVSSEAQGQVKP